jgi:hypothetical protein
VAGHRYDVSEPTSAAVRKEDLLDRGDPSCTEPLAVLAEAYAAAGDFGLTDAQIDERFATYNARFRSAAAPSRRV